MKLTWIWIGLAGLLSGAAGCSGINASHSVSPASFFLPGLIRAEPSGAPAPAATPAAAAEPTLVVQAN